MSSINKAEQHQSPYILLGGTFDPVHFGHLRMAQEMLNKFPSADVFLMPSAYPPHRSEPAASPEQRIEMLRLVLDSIPHLHVDTRELERETPSYSVISLAEIREEIGSKSLIFIMGTDAFAKLDQWHRWQELLGLTNILVIGRPSCELPREGIVAETYAQCSVSSALELANHQNGKIAYYQMPQLDISSTFIRDQIKNGKSPRFLMPSVIIDYIQTHSLYKTGIKA